MARRVVHNSSLCARIVSNSRGSGFKTIDKRHRRPRGCVDAEQPTEIWPDRSAELHKTSRVKHNPNNRRTRNGGSQLFWCVKKRIFGSGSASKQQISPLTRLLLWHGSRPTCPNGYRSEPGAGQANRPFAAGFWQSETISVTFNPYCRKFRQTTVLPMLLCRRHAHSNGGVQYLRSSVCPPLIGASDSETQTPRFPKKGPTTR